jgi:hypothetical protein
VRLTIQCDHGLPTAFDAIGKCNVHKGDAGFTVMNANYIDIGFDIGANPNMFGGIQNQNGNSVHIIGNYVHDLAANRSDGTGKNGCPNIIRQGLSIVTHRYHGYRQYHSALRRDCEWYV